MISFLSWETSTLREGYNIAKSVGLTEEGLANSERWFEQYFGLAKATEEE